MRPRLKFQRLRPRINRSIAANGRGSSDTYRPWHSKLRRGALNLSHLEPIDCPLPNLQIFLACVISGIDLIFHSFYRNVVLTSWDRGLSDCETAPGCTR